MDRPTAATGAFPYFHRTLAQVRHDEVEAVRRDVHWDAVSAAFNRRAPVDDGPMPTWRPVVVDRDPCPRCGVRGDFGCSHGARA